MEPGVNIDLELLIREFSELVEKGSLAKIKTRIREIHPADIAEIITNLDRKDQVVLFRLLSKNTAIEVFERIDLVQQENLLSHFTDDKVSEILNQMSADDRTELLDELPAKVVRKLLPLLSNEQRAIASLLLGYPENSAGRIMNPQFIDLKEYQTVSQAIERIRKIAPPEELTYIAYVIDGERHLIGSVTLRKLILADPAALIRDIMNREVVSTHTDSDQESVVRTIQRYDLLAAPVTDRENRLVGVVTVDDAMDIIEEEATEDIHRLAAIKTTEDEYLRSGVWQRVKNRFVWLALLLMGGTVASFIIQNYEGFLQTVIALAFFIPVLIDTGGNVGSQSTAVMVRGLALQNIDRKNFLKMILTEGLIGGILGILLALIGFLRAALLGEGYLIGIVVGLSLWVIVIFSNLLGLLLPLVLKKMKFDPALSATPVITTIVDVVGVAIYFQIARILLT
ncbi:MAG TPA: magnesium transporter [Atribacteraceae bacterium]|nr:magnesium transporter [Atribacteraceae bacterium]